MDSISVAEVVQGLGSSEDSLRKKAAFRLQTLIGDPSFTDQFISDGGLEKLQYLCKHANGNTLAYTLASFSTLLELDQGWEYLDEELVERVSERIPDIPSPTPQGPLRGRESE